MNQKPLTHQQMKYEALYQSSDSEYGMPDRKITDGPVSGKRILSLGSGTGHDLWYLCDANTVIGLDYATSGLAIGQRHGMQCVVGDLNTAVSLPFESKSLDIIVCKDVLEHILEPLAILQEVKRLLKDDGFLVISVPNHFYLPFRLRILMGSGLIWKTVGLDHHSQYDEWNYMHIRFFTYPGFKRFLSQAGLWPEKWFWDFGTLAHYQNPDMWLEPQLRKKKSGQALSSRGKLGVRVILPIWRTVNFLFPRRLRSRLVSLSPGLLCAGFYVRVRKA